MANRIRIKVDLTKLYGAFIHTIQGKQASEECVCIPARYFYHGKDGALYLDMVGFEQTQYGKLYSIKQDLLKEDRDRLREQGVQTPFIGDIRPITSSTPAEQVQPSPIPEPQPAPRRETFKTPEVSTEGTDDLPF